MKSITSILAKPPFNFFFTQEDITIFEQIHKNYKDRLASEEYSLLFANITFILINKQILDYLLAHLEAEIKQSWESTLGIHEPQEYISCLGLTWPLPSELLANNHSRHLLSKTLLKNERKHGINLDDNKGAPVPTLFGYVSPDLVAGLISKSQLWNDETRVTGLLFHGKQTHRIQLNLIMKAIELKILDVDQLKMPDLLKVFTTTRIRSRLTLAWDVLFDNINLDSYIKDEPTVYDDPVQNAISQHYSRNISEGSDVGRYVYCADPYYFHSYLMTHSRVRAPHLSECVTQSFAKSAYAIQRIESEIGQKIENGPPAFLVRERVHTLRGLQPHELDMRSVLKRQEECFVRDGKHVVDEKTAKAFDAKRGKLSRIINSIGNIEYRRVLNDDCEAEFKRAKV
jgi:hypothetical protein